MDYCATCGEPIEPDEELGESRFSICPSCFDFKPGTTFGLNNAPAGHSNWKCYGKPTPHGESQHRHMLKAAQQT